MADPDRSDSLSSWHDLRQQIAEGLLYTHSRLNANTRQTLEAASFLYALVELLVERGLITVEDLDERKRAAGERLAQQLRDQGIGAVFQEPEHDKYTFDSQVEIDCASRVHLCRATCCRLPFALSRQDIREGIVRWDLGQPYMIEHDADGACVHLAADQRGCGVYPNRPVPCRAFDCRNDPRIWLDFDKRIPNPDVERPDWIDLIARIPGKDTLE